MFLLLLACLAMADDRSDFAIYDVNFFSDNEYECPEWDVAWGLFSDEYGDDRWSISWGWTDAKCAYRSYTEDEHDSRTYYDENKVQACG